jgi:hypothetical protein
LPKIPRELAAQLKQLDRWLFSSRPIDNSLATFRTLCVKADGTEDKDYALLSHSGLGSNSWALRTRIGNEKSMQPFISPPIPLILELWRYADLSFPIHISS